MTHERDLFRVAAEFCNVLLDPFQGEVLVPEAHVAGRLLRLERQKAYLSKVGRHLRES